MIANCSNQPICLIADCCRMTDTILQAEKANILFRNGPGCCPPFWNAECQAVVDSRERAHAAATRSGHNSEDVRQYQVARAAADRVVAQHKTEFFHKKIAVMGPDKDMWGLVKAMEQGKAGSPQLNRQSLLTDQVRRASPRNRPD